MARPARLHLAGGFYHVTLRGNHRQPIFFRLEDRELLDQVVADSIVKLGARVHAYCWMTNHLHMLIQVSDVILGRVILRIAGRYARTVQLRLDTTGHLFERRYHAVLVDADRYLLAVIRYVHLNPVAAGMAASADAYPWSSHGAYLGIRSCDWLTTDFALRLLATEPSAQRASYCRFMQSAEPCQWGAGVLAPNAAHRNILGGDEFVARVAASRFHMKSQATLDELCTECGRRFGVDRESLLVPGNGRRLARARAWIAHEAVAGRIATVCGIATKLGRTESAIRALMERYPHATLVSQSAKVRPGTE